MLEWIISSHCLSDPKVLSMAQWDHQVGPWSPTVLGAGQPAPQSVGSLQTAWHSASLSQPGSPGSLGQGQASWVFKELVIPSALELHLLSWSPVISINPSCPD